VKYNYVAKCDIKKMMAAHFSKNPKKVKPQWESVLTAHSCSKWIELTSCSCIFRFSENASKKNKDPLKFAKNRKNRIFQVYFAQGCQYFKPQNGLYY
jgi:hypothetical protein